MDSSMSVPVRSLSGLEYQDVPLPLGAASTPSETPSSPAATSDGYADNMAPYSSGGEENMFGGLGVSRSPSHSSRRGGSGTPSVVNSRASSLSGSKQKSARSTPVPNPVSALQSSNQGGDKSDSEKSEALGEIQVSIPYYMLLPPGSVKWRPGHSQENSAEDSAEDSTDSWPEKSLAPRTSAPKKATTARKTSRGPKPKTAAAKRKDDDSSESEWGSGSEAVPKAVTARESSREPKPPRTAAAKRKKKDDDSSGSEWGPGKKAAPKQRFRRKGPSKRARKNGGTGKNVQGDSGGEGGSVKVKSGKVKAGKAEQGIQDSDKELPRFYRPRHAQNDVKYTEIGSASE